MNNNTVWQALALMLVFEGILPFAAPARWRKVFTQLQQMTDGQIRFFGLLSIALGALLICLL